MDRRSDEHWAGRLYMRGLSIHVTRRLIDAPVTPNGLTLMMGLVGFIAAGVLVVPTLWAVITSALLVQIYLLLDCVDGEVARWRQATSAAGVYLDRLGHYTVEAALVIALGARASAIEHGMPIVDVWTLLGLMSALFVVLARAEGDLVIVARASAGLPEVTGSHEPRPGAVRLLRRVVRSLPFHRVLGAVELSLFAVVAALVDIWFGPAMGTRLLMVVVSVAGAIVVVGHAMTILTSERLR